MGGVSVARQEVLLTDRHAESSPQGLVGRGEVRDLFSPAARARGLEYFRSGRIALESRNADELRFKATGTYDYRVTFVKDTPRLILACECPYFEDGFPCKHLWGALMALEASGELRDWMPQGDVHVVVDLPPSDAWSNETTRSLPDSGAAWKAPFDRIRDAGARRGAVDPAETDIEPGGVVYVVDVQASRTYSSLTLAVSRRDRKKNGEWGKPKPLRIHRSEIEQLPEEADRRLVALLLGSSEWQAALDYSPLPPRVFLSAELAQALLPELCATGRLFLARGPSIDPNAIAWDGHDPWGFRLQLRPGAEEGARRYYVSGWLTRGGERVALSEPHLVTPSIVFVGKSAAPFDAGGAWPWVVELRGNPSIAVPAAHADRLLETIFSLDPLPPIELPEELQVVETSPDPVPCLRLFHSDRRLVEGQRGSPPGARISARVAFDYGGVEVPGLSRGGGIYKPGSRALLRRRADRERDAVRQLRRLGFRRMAAASGEQAMIVDSERVPAAIRDLVAAGWRVEAEGRLYRQASRSRLSVTSGIDWFELHGTAEFGDQAADLPTLLGALARGERVVRLGDGTFGLLPEEWLSRVAGIGEFGRVEGDHLRFRPSQVAVLDALLTAQPQAKVDETFERARRALDELEAPMPLDPPPAFVGTLRGYQREGLGWLQFLHGLGFGGCLADDMGLGKTVMVLALLERHRETSRRPSLVVAPRSVAFNWLREAERFTPRMRTADYTGADRGAILGRLEDVDLLVTTYGTVRQDAARLKDVDFDYVILDESQAIKNAGTASAKAARLLRSAHRLALSGTPIENHVGELWSLFDFLNPGMLGSRSALARRRAALDAARNGRARVQADGVEADGADAAPDRTGTSLVAPPPPATPAGPSQDLQLLARIVRPFILRRTKEQVARDLPERQEETIWCELEAAERRLYDELRDHYRAALLGLIEQRGLERSKLQVLEALLRLRQAACHPGLLDRSRAAGGSAKLDALLPQLAELREEGHKALVFSQFTSLLAILRGHLDREGVTYEYLDGQTRDREARVARFQQQDDCGLFLISLKAGGLGMNLTAADYVFLLDPWWNPAAEAQAIDRAHRIGQTRPVFAYRLIARDTVEERILELQRQKRDLAEAIITADNSVISNLTREDLESLLA